MQVIKGSNKINNKAVHKNILFFFWMCEICGICQPKNFNL